MIPVKNRYNEIFEVQVDGWCYGISSFPGEISSGLVHRVLKELQPVFRESIEHFYVFDVIAVSQKFSKAAKFLVHEREVAFSILHNLPNPSGLSEDCQFILAQVIEKVEQVHGGAIERLQKKWDWEKRQHAA